MDIATSQPQDTQPKETPSAIRRFNHFFHEFARRISLALGSSWAFILAIVVIVVWGFTGPYFQYSDTWQLIINTGTTIVTFLMVFLIQNTQNRDAKAIHLKLDELIRSVRGARNRLVDLENMTDEELDRLQEDFRRLRQRTEERKLKAEIKAEGGTESTTGEHAAPTRDQAG